MMIILGYYPGKRWKQERRVYSVNSEAPTIVSGDHGQLRIHIGLEYDDEDEEPKLHKD